MDPRYHEACIVWMTVLHALPEFSTRPGRLQSESAPLTLVHFSYCTYKKGKALRTSPDPASPIFSFLFTSLCTCTREPLPWVSSLLLTMGSLLPRLLLPSPNNTPARSRLGARSLNPGLTLLSPASPCEPPSWACSSPWVACFSDTTLVRSLVSRKCLTSLNVTVNSSPMVHIPSATSGPV